MSFQRAEINCRRCYALARGIINSDASGDGINNSDSLYNARNEALRAVVDAVVDACRIGQYKSKIGPYKSKFIEDDYIKKMIDVSVSARNACASCNYEDSNIARLISDSLDKS